MTESEWNSCTDPQKMLEWLRRNREVSERKMRLFGLAYCRRLSALARARWSTELLTAAERYFDAPDDERLEEWFRKRRPLDRFDAQVMRPAVRALALASRRHGFALSPARICVEAVRYAADAARRPHREPVAQARFFRDIFANPFCPRPLIAPRCLAWNDGIVRRLAAAIYEERMLPQGTLDRNRLAVLGDALEESGCADADILGHLRGSGPHVRGCFGRAPAQARLQSRRAHTFAAASCWTSCWARSNAVDERDMRKVFRFGPLVGLVAAAVTILGIHLAVAWLNQEPPNYSQIENGLYLGGYVPEPPRDAKAVLNLCEVEDPYKVVAHRWKPIRDAEPAPTLDWLREQVEFIATQREAGRAVFVHCRNGVSRSGMVVVSYLMFRHGWSRDEALTFIRSRRPMVRPNPAFMALLREWEQSLKSAQTGH
ncbi:MAG TPA: dual specificity protein phosphatase [Gemmataceae bacterium]|nr:dual specificity protein phosphatase [Gemmataceae bacterium]